MCDYSLEGYATRQAEVGDKLVINEHFHGFMSEADSASLTKKLKSTHPQLESSDVCFTCLKEGTVLRMKIASTTFENVRFTQIKRDLCRDHLVTENGSVWRIAGLPRGTTTAEVISIPGQKPKEPEQSLDEKLGLDKLDKPVREPREPVLARVLARVMGALRPVTA